MSTRPRRVAAALVLFGVSSLGTLMWAADKFQPIAPDELKMTSESLAPGVPAIILFRQLDRDDSNGGRVHEENYYRIKILTEAGRKYADREIPYIKGVDEVLNIRARTIKPDGSVVEFDGQVFEKSLVKARKINVMAKTFTLPAVEPGCVIEYSYTLDLKHAYASHWILSDSLFTKRAQFSLKPYKGGMIPLSFRQNWQNLPPGAELKEGTDHIYRMEANNVAAFQTEDHMPPENELKARVDFSYELGRTENDPNQYWRRVGSAWNQLLENFVGKQKAMQSATGQIISSSDAPEVKLRKIYDHVQNMRNTSFEFQKTEQETKREKEKFDENVEDVWKRGYGKGWQLDWLFLGLVRAAGFEAYGCWVSSRAEYFFTPQTMQSGHLNESAVLVKLNGKDLYFHPGGAFVPFGLLNWSETATPGLRLDKDGGTWIKTEPPKASESAIRRIANLKLSEDGALEGKLTVTYTGLEAMYHRVSGMHADEVARKKMLEDSVKTQIPGQADVEMMNHPDWDSSEKPLVAEFDLKIPNWSSNAGKRSILPAGIFTANEKRVFEHNTRIYPIYFDYPYEKADDVTIELPTGWQISSVPPAQTQDGHIVTYSLKVENDQGTLHLSRDFTVNFILLEQKYYTALRAFFQAVRSGDEQQIVLQPAATAASN